MSWLSRTVNAFRPSRLDRGLDEEITFHIQSRIDDLVAAGMTPQAAEVLTRRQFGNRLRLREESRDVKLLPWLDSLVRDVRLGARMLRKNGLTTAAAIVSLSLALGACVAAFSLVDALILKPLPVYRPDQLIYLTVPSGNPDAPEKDDFSDPVFVRLREAGRGYVDLFAIRYPDRPRVTFDVANADRETVRSQFVSGDTFERLGVGAAAGRLLTMQDDREPGAHPVAVLSYAFWMRRFGGDPGIVGHWFVVHDRQADRSFQIVGVADRRFGGAEPGHPMDVWLPYAMQDPHAFGNNEYNSVRVIGRLREGIQLAQVRSLLQAAFTNFRREYAPGHVDPAWLPDRVERFINTPLSVRPASNGPSPLRAQFARPLWILTAIAVLVLLIAGSNVANLFLARAAAREREMSLRLSLGAGRGRLMQQVLVESALVACAACLIGLVFAAFAAPSVVGMLASSDDPVVLDLRVDWRLVVIIAGAALSITALFGLAPARRASSVEPMTVLKEGGGRVSPRRGVARPFVAMQVAFSLIVLFVGSLLVRSFMNLSSVNPGFAASDVLLVSWEAVQRVEPSQQRAALLQVLDRLRDLPGIAAVSAAEFNVLGRPWRNIIPVPGTASETIEATMAPVTPGYFETMQIPLLAGRTFVRSDLNTENPTGVVVSESFATRYFGREAAVGRRFDARFGKARTPNEVVGVVADVRYDLRKPPAPTIYMLSPLDRFKTLHVRVAGDSTTIAARLREEVRAATPLLRVTSIASEESMVNRTLVRERLLALLAGFFALVGLVLTAVGLYGTLSFAVVQRTREIGIRVALGARASGAVRAILMDAAVTTSIGAVCGITGGLYASRFLETMIFEVGARDPSSLTLPFGTLLLTALAAAAVPAWRAARVDPVVALRIE